MKTGDLERDEKICQVCFKLFSCKIDLLKHSTSDHSLDKLKLFGVTVSGAEHH